MERVIFGGVEVNRCTDCHGLFFDEFEKEQLLKMKHSGRDRYGRSRTRQRIQQSGPDHLPALRQPDDPHGRSRPTAHLVRALQSLQRLLLRRRRIRDLKHHTILDFFRDLTARERR
jgi:Zn-finger nucleic acid-binding protein